MATDHISYKASLQRSIDVKNPVYPFPGAWTTSILVTMDVIHDTICTNTLVFQHLSLCCYHDKSFFFYTTNQHISFDHMIIALEARGM